MHIRGKASLLVTKYLQGPCTSQNKFSKVLKCIKHDSNLLGSWDQQNQLLSLGNFQNCCMVSILLSQKYRRKCETINL